MTLNFDSYYLEPIQEKDAWRLCDFVVSNEERLKRFFPGTLASNLTPELATLFAKIKVKEFSENEEFLYTLKTKFDRSLIGMVYLKELNWKTKQGELAYCIGYTHEGQGIMTKAINSISEWAFTSQKLKTLQIIVHKTNLSSTRIAQKCGFTWQKILLNAHTPPNEKPLDMELYERYRAL